MKKTLVIMDTHLNDINIFDRSRTDYDAWMFNKAPNLKNEKGKYVYPKSDAFFQLHHEAIWENPKNRNCDVETDTEGEPELEWEDLIIQRLVQIIDT